VASHVIGRTLPVNNYQNNTAHLITKLHNQLKLQEKQIIFTLHHSTKLPADNSRIQYFQK